MAELKTRPTKASVPGFLKAVADPQVRADARVVADLMQEVTGVKPVMWGPTIVGFGSFSYESRGTVNTWPAAGFAPRGRELVVYLAPGFSKDPLLAKLGKHRHGVSCLYVKRLADLDLAVLRELIEKSIASIPSLYPPIETAGAKKKAPAKKKSPAKKKAPAKKKKA
jgi:hypothetical protein